MIIDQVSAFPANSINSPTNFENNTLPSTNVLDRKARYRIEQIRSNVQLGRKIVEGLELQYSDLSRAKLLDNKQIKRLKTSKTKIKRCINEVAEIFLEGNQKDKTGYYRCKNKLCPCCASREYYLDGLRIFAKMTSFINNMYVVFAYSPKNPKIEDLNFFTRKLKRSSSKVFNLKLKGLKGLVNGTIRVIEFDYRFFTEFHPHIHLVINLERPITKEEGQILHDLLTKRFYKIMEFRDTETKTDIYENTLENFKRTATYLTKFNNRYIYESISSMKKESFSAYFDTIDRLREIEYTGCFREKKEYGKAELTAEYNRIFIRYGTLPVKLFEYKTVLRSDSGNEDVTK